jgi:hypothetical protein
MSHSLCMIRNQNDKDGPNDSPSSKHSIVMEKHNTSHGESSRCTYRLLLPHAT